MELEQYIEQDIQAFLDIHQEMATHRPKAMTERKTTTLMPEEMGLYTPNMDYMRDFDDAIKSSNILRARKVLLDLKEEYDRYPLDAPERPQLKLLFEKLYERFQLEAQHLGSPIKVTVELSEKTGRSSPSASQSAARSSVQLPSVGGEGNDPFSMLDRALEPAPSASLAPLASSAPLSPSDPLVPFAPLAPSAPVPAPRTRDIPDAPSLEDGPADKPTAAILLTSSSASTRTSSPSSGN